MRSREEIVNECVKLIVNLLGFEAVKKTKGVERLVNEAVNELLELPKQVPEQPSNS